jgi:pyruvate dehydrogenase E2 component (dihydrolipoamide acetyltransferase)
MTTNQIQQPIKMPKLGLTMTEATLVRWLKTEGEPVSPGEILFEFESDKSLMEFESPAAGVLGQILVAEGETVPCGVPVAQLQVAKTKETTAQPGQSVAPAGGDQPAAAIASSPAPSRSGFSSIFATPAAKRIARKLGVDLARVNGRGPGGRIQRADVEVAARTVAPPAGRTSTPLAKRLAREYGVDWTRIEGSGPSGRVVKADILAASQAEAGPSPAPSDAGYDSEPLSAIRRVIARRMTDSAFSAPHVTLFTEVDATNLVEARTQLNTELNGAIRLSYNALLVSIVARALREFPAMNANLVDDEIRRYHDIHVALAVDTERGLLVPVIRQADRLDLLSIQQTGDTLIERALAGRSLPDDLTGGTFTITNLGMFEIDGFTPIINQPQAAILGVGRIVAKPVAVDNAVVVRRMLILSLSFDHRLVDGGPAARFLQRIKQLIERPFALLLSPPAAGLNH